MPEGRWRACCPTGTTPSRRPSRGGQRVLISAHGSSIRALVKYLDGISDNEIVGLNIPNGIPLVYWTLDAALKPIRHYYLGDAEAAARGNGGGQSGKRPEPGPNHSGCRTAAPAAGERCSCPAPGR